MRISGLHGKESGVRRMLIKIEGKNEVLNDLEEVQKLIDKARDILYRTHTQIKIVVEECDTKTSDCQDTQ